MRERHVNLVVDGLYQGDYMAPAYLRPQATLHIGCACELRPSLNSAKYVLFFPLDDDPSVPWLDNPAWVGQVKRAASIAAGEVLAGNRVLITCAMGLNRSGVVTAMTLRQLGFDPDEAIEMVRAARGQLALCNPRFVEVIEQA